MSDSSYAAGGYVPGPPALDKIPTPYYVWSAKDVAAFLAQMQARG